MAPWKPVTGAGLKFLRGEFLPAVPSCQFWVDKIKSELCLASLSLTLLQKQLARLQMFDLRE